MICVQRESGYFVAVNSDFMEVQEKAMWLCRESRSAWARIASPSRSRMRAHISRLALVLTLALGACSPAFAQSPGENFGYRATPIWGSIPVLTILWQISDTERFPFTAHWTG